MRIGRKKGKKVRFHEMRDSLMEDDICKSGGERGRWRVGKGIEEEKLLVCLVVQIKKRQSFLQGK
jgi:hypothetical protein